MLESSNIISGRNKSQSENWFTTDLGNSFQVAAAAELVRVLPQSYFSVALDLGPGTVQYLQHLDTGFGFRINPNEQVGSRPTVIGDWEGLPLGRNSVDLVVLQHTLDYSIDPRQVLREVVEILSAEGWIVICGFNPLGLWGVSRIFFRSSGKVPWSARFLMPSRVQDWLALLGTEVMGGSFFFYRPPMRSLRLLQKLSVLEHVGRRWWPSLAGAYLIVGRKREIATFNSRKNFPVSRRQLTQVLHTTKTVTTVSFGEPS